MLLCKWRATEEEGLQCSEPVSFKSVLGPGIEGEGYWGSG